MTKLSAAVPLDAKRVTQKLGNIQILRFIAAAMVVVSHLEHEAVRIGYVPAGWINWNAGVDIFFVISGFIMYLLSSGDFGVVGRPWKFLSRRIARIAPLYWIFTTVMLVAMVAFSSYVDHSKLDVMHIVASYLFVPWVDSHGGVKPILGVGWTLNYEMLFYLLFAASLVFPKKIGLFSLYAFFGAAVVVGFWIPNDSVAGFVTHPIILEFLLGVTLAAIYLKGARVGKGAAVAVGMIGFVLLSVFHGLGLGEGDWRVFGAGLPALLIVAAFALAPNLDGKSLVAGAAILAGDASYALYLSHAFTLNIVFLVWRKLGIGMPVLYIVVGLGIAVLASIVVFSAVERPLLKIVQGKRRAQIAAGDRRSVEVEA